LGAVRFIINRFISLTSFHFSGKSESYFLSSQISPITDRFLVR
jgi:hypothetical protein